MSENQITDLEVTEFKNVYSPRTLLGVYANAIRTTADGRVVLAKGNYQLAQNQKEYSGFYYDSLKSLNGNESIKIKVPTLLRSKLENNAVYIFKGYVEKRINFSSIELVFVIDDLLQKEENQISEEEIKRFELIQKKIAKEYRDVESLVKENIYQGNIIKIANLYGNTAIVNEDFKLGLAEAITKFNITEHRCSFSSKTQLIATIQRLKVLDYDIIALVRGGGEKQSLEIFNDSELGNEAISIKPVLVTALGHKQTEETLLDKIADKKFALPHDYGNSLKVWVDQAIEAQAKSKSVFIEQVKKDLAKTYTEQITTVQKQLEARNKEFEMAQIKFKEMVEQNQKDKLETIKAKEKTFEANLKTLTEQIKAKDESIKVFQSKFEEQLKAKDESLKVLQNNFTEQFKAKGESLKVFQSKFEEQLKAKDENLKLIQSNNEEQLKAKDENLKLIQSNNEVASKQQIASAVAEFKTKYEITNNERDKLARQLEDATKANRNLIIYIIVALVIGLIIGLII